MSNEKKVWAGLLEFDNVNIYSIGASYPNLLDYPAYHRVKAETIHDRENELLNQKKKALFDKSFGIDKIIQAFNKLPVLPDGLWLDDKTELPKPTDYIFNILGNALVVNEACANVLKQFRLGESTLTPVKIHNLYSGDLWLEETFYFLNLCEQRHDVIHPQSHNELKYNRGIGDYSGVLRMKHDLLETQKNAQNCDVDLWHDPLLRESYFISDALHNALIEAKLDEKWDFHSCKLV